MIKNGNMAILLLALSSILILSLPEQEISREQTVDSDLIKIPDIGELEISNLDFTHLTLNWAQPHDTMEISTYRIYQDGKLLATVPKETTFYKVTGLKANTWYQFSVEGCGTSKDCGNVSLIGVNTLTVNEACDSIINEINDLVSSGILNKEISNNLIKELTCIYELDQDRANVTNHLRAFIDNVNSLISKGVLPNEKGQPMINTANEIIKNLP